MARAGRQYKDGIYHVTELLKQRPDEPQLYEMRALFRMQDQDTIESNEQVVADLKTAIEKKPNYIAAYARLAEFYRQRMGNRSAASGVIEEMMTSNLNSAEAFVARAQFNLNDRDPAVLAPQMQLRMLQESAMLDCQKAQELDAGNLAAIEVLSQCHERLAPLMDEEEDRAEQIQLAMTLMRQLVQARPEIPQLYMRLADLELKASLDPDSMPQRLEQAIAGLRTGIQNVAPDQRFLLKWRLADLLMSDSETRPEADQLIAELEKGLAEDAAKQKSDEFLRIQYLKCRQLVSQQEWRRPAVRCWPCAATCSGCANWRIQ